MLFGYGSSGYDDFGVVLVFSGRQEKVPPLDFSRTLAGPGKAFCMCSCVRRRLIFC
jgi:hypothetical protein